MDFVKLKSQSMPLFRLSDTKILELKNVSKVYRRMSNITTSKWNGQLSLVAADVLYEYELQLNKHYYSLSNVMCRR